jgi:hypothetical protein
MSFPSRPWSAAGLLVMSAAVLRADVDPQALPQVSYHPGGPAYWDRPYFANAMSSGSWVDQNFQTLPYWSSAQFDANGFPQTLLAGQTEIRAIVNGLHAGYGASPANFPDLRAIFRGHWVVTWQGNADIRLDGTATTYLPGESSGAATGALVNGRRVYRVTDAPGWISVRQIVAPVTDIKVWMPDPANPQNASVENQLFHPSFLARVNQASWGLVRTMGFTETNASPVQDWTDRRRPRHAFAVGILNTRPPANGFSGNRATGVAYEHLVALSNAAQKDLWINVPHLATDDFVQRLARLIRFGSDGTNPYTSPQASPVWAPLAANLRVYVEYSNEIWSNGDSFAQGNWAQDQANAAGISKPRFNARRFSQVWRIFQQEFGGSTRIVRAAAVFTASQAYTGEFLNELRDYGPTQVPAVTPDLIACTTYFGNGIQDWAHAKAQQQAGTSDPWFYTTALFDPGNGQLRPVSLPATDPYWRSKPFQRHLSETLSEWRRRMLGGSASEGGGPDATGFGGGFEVWLRQLALTTFPQPKALVAYEGGPSLYTDYLDGGDVRDDGVTTFMSALNRHGGIRQLYDIHLNLAKSKGLRTHSAFVDAGVWGKYGQWGHLEHWGQSRLEAPKHFFLLDWIQQMASVRHVDDALGLTPDFVNAPSLAPAIVGQPYSADVLTTDGNGARTVRVVGTSLSPGLQTEPLAGDPGGFRVAGTPSVSGPNYAYARVVDGDGDPAWRVFSFYAAGGPGTLVDADLRGDDPGLHTPWTAAYVTDPSVASYGGLVRGAGSIGAAGDDAFTYSVNAPQTESTLAQAVAENEYVGVTLTAAAGQPFALRRGTLRFTINRQDYHSPRRYAVFTSVGGFAAGQEVFLSPLNTDLDEPRELVVTLPDTAAYDGLASVQIRIYGYAANFGGHRTRLTAFKLSERVAALTARDPKE